jgi:L-gulonolactone oxidase
MYTSSVHTIVHEHKGAQLTDPLQHIARFKAVRQKFDPNGMFRSVVGEILGMY